VTSSAPHGLPSFLGSEGELARLIASHDWNGSLGPIEAWPSSLKTAVGLLIHSPIPMVLLWGPLGYMLYNDAYSVFAGVRHPALLGSEVRKGWPEVASFNDNVMRVGLAGGTLSYKDQELTLDRTGTPQQAWMNLDYSPVMDESGKPGGVIAIVVETTERVLSERRLAAATTHQRRQFEQAPGFVIIMTGPDHVVDFVNETHRRVFGSHDWVGRPIRDAFPSIEGQGFFDQLDSVYRTGTTFETSGAEVRFRRAPDEPMERRYLSFIYAPITDESGAVTGIFCDGYDVTERETATAALRQSEALFRFLDDLGRATSRSQHAHEVLATTLDT
jgi:PAS domain-containing protein